MTDPDARTGSARSPEPTSLFVATSPLHVFLASCICLGRKDGEQNHLVLQTDFAGAEALCAAVGQWTSTPFQSVTLVPGYYGRRSLVARVLVVTKNARRLHRWVRKLQPDGVFVFNDTTAEAQAVLHAAKTANPRAKGVCVEEGAAFYNNQSARYDGRWHARLLRKLLYGNWWEDVEVGGTTSRIDELHVTFPEFLRPELKGKRSVRVPVEAARSPEMVEFAAANARAAGADETSLRGAEVLLAVAYSVFADKADGYADLMRQICHKAGERGLRVAVKYHPRETRGDFCNLEELGNVDLIPRSLSMETIFVLARMNLRHVVGDYSTALLTARWLADSATTWSLGKLMSHPDPGLLDLFTRAGIRCVSDMADFMDSD